jgi:hypothetical protein
VPRPPCAAAAYGWWEKDQFEVRQETVPILPGRQGIRSGPAPERHPLRAGPGKKAQWLQSLAALKPDLVVNTGDNLSHPKAMDPLISALRTAHGVPGRFCSGLQRLLRAADQEPGRLLPRTIQTQNRTPRKLDWPKLRSAFGMGGWIDLTNRHQSVVLNGMRFDFSGVDDPHLNRERYAGWPRGTVNQDAAPT